MTRDSLSPEQQAKQMATRLGRAFYEAHTRDAAERARADAAFRQAIKPYCFVTVTGVALGAVALPLHDIDLASVGAAIIGCTAIYASQELRAGRLGQRTLHPENSAKTECGTHIQALNQVMRDYRSLAEPSKRQQKRLDHTLRRLEAKALPEPQAKAASSRSEPRAPGRY